MARHSKKQLAKFSKKIQAILTRSKPRIGTFPGMNRSRKFVDRKRKANRNACRGKARDDS